MFKMPVVTIAIANYFSTVLTNEVTEGIDSR